MAFVIRKNMPFIQLREKNIYITTLILEAGHAITKNSGGNGEKFCE